MNGFMFRNLRQIRAHMAGLALLTATFLPTEGLALEPEQIGVKTLPNPTETWLMARDGLGTLYIFDSATGDMHGLLGISQFTPAVQPNLQATEFYAAESYYSRNTRGERTDVLTIYDMPTLNPKAEIKIPNKLAALPFRRYIALLDDQRFLAIFNLTPAQSVSVVDLQNQSFVTELSTPGCALTIPTVDRAFLQLCGDGKIQLIRLGTDGNEQARVRSRAFFDIPKDPVFDKTARTAEGWLLLSYEGQVFDVSVEDEKIDISDAWQLLDDDQRAENWRPGGGQFFTYHEGLDLLFVLMNNVGGYSHDHAGNEVWVYDRSAKRLVSRLPLPQKGTNVFVSRNDDALLTVTGTDRQLHVYDVKTMKLVRTIGEVGVSPGYLQGVTH